MIVGGDGESRLLFTRGCGQRSQHGNSTRGVGTSYAGKKVLQNMLLIIAVIHSN